MADWRSLYEKWAEVSDEMKNKIYELFVEKEEKLPALFAKEPFAKKIYDEFFLPELEEEERKAAALAPPPIPPTPEVRPPAKFVQGQQVIFKGKPYNIVELSWLAGWKYTLDDPSLPKLIDESFLKTPVEAVEQKWKPGKKATYRWTGEEYEVVSTAKWPFILLKDKYGHMDTKNENQLVTAEEYEALKKEQERKVEKAKKERVAREVPRLYRERERPREAVLRDIFYATLSREGVPVKEGYRARWRIELPKILQLATAEEQEKRAQDFSMEIINEYKAEQEARRERLVKPPPRVAPPRFKLPLGWQPVEGGYLVNGRFISEEEAPKMLPPEVAVPAVPVERERLLLTGMAERRCPSPDHKDPEWIKRNPDVEEEFPGGLFLADLNEERLAFCLPTFAYYRNRRFNGYCPYHRKKEFGVWLTTVGKWAEVYAWMFKVSGGRQGLDPALIENCIRQLDLPKTLADYDRPVTWIPPGAVFEYWKSIGWRAPQNIEEVWDKEFEEEHGKKSSSIFELYDWLKGISERRKKGEIKD